MRSGRTGSAAVGLLLILGACSQNTASTQAPTKRTTTLRQAAALDACPGSISRQLPDLRLPCLGAPGVVPLRGPGTGKPTLVNVWATWCGPCARETPELVALADAAAGRLALVGVLTQDPAENGLEFARQVGMRYPSVVDDDGKVMRAYSPGPPVTLFLDATGHVTFVQRGEIRGQKRLHDLVRKHLGLTIAVPAGHLTASTSALVTFGSAARS